MIVKNVKKVFKDEWEYTDTPDTFVAYLINGFLSWRQGEKNNIKDLTIFKFK